MTLVYLATAPLLAAVLSFLLAPQARWLAARIGAVDRPGLRKVHTAEVPRLGGLAVVASGAIVTSLLLWFELPRLDRIADDLALGLGFGLLPILAVSLVDDIRPLRALPRFLAQLAGASLAVGFGVRLGAEVRLFGESVPLGWAAIPLSLFWLVGVTNAFNIVDGLDGLSAGLALLSAASLAGASLMVGQYGLAMLALVLAGALAGFLPHNLYPAKIFLGDTGAAAIGFILACLALRGGSTLSSGLAILTPMLVLGLPIAETLVSMLRRVVRGLRSGGQLGVFEADSGHFHHRLLALGLDQRRAVLVLYGIGLVLALAGFGSLFLTQKKAAVLLLTIVGAGSVGLSRLGYDEFAVLRRGDLLRVYEVPVLRRGAFVVFVDLAIVAFAIYAAFALKYDDWALATNRGGAVWLLTVLPPVSLMSFAAFRLYQRTWRFASVGDLVFSSLAATTAVAVGMILSLLFNRSTPPASWFGIYYMVALLGLNGSRASYRLLQESWRRAQTHGEPVLIYGAGRGGAMVLREALSNPEANMRPIGFVDDDTALSGKVFDGYPVFGSSDVLEAVIVDNGIRGLVVATDKLPPDRIATVLRICERRGIWMRQFRVRFESQEVAAESTEPAPVVR